MLNPFKKKEDNSFKLDEYSLPSLNESSPQSSSQNSAPPSDVPQPPSSQPSSNQSFPSTPPQEENYENYQAPMPSSSPFPTQQNTMSSNAFEQQNQSTQENSSNHNEVSKAKLEMMESKLSLLDARVASIDQKLQVIYEMLAAEISDETRQKLNVKSMVNSAKERNQ